MRPASHTYGPKVQPGSQPPHYQGPGPDMTWPPSVLSRCVSLSWSHAATEAALHCTQMQQETLHHRQKGPCKGILHLNPCLSVPAPTTHTAPLCSRPWQSQKVRDGLMGGGASIQKDYRDVCSQAERSWDEMHGICISQTYSPFHVCAWPHPILSPSLGSPHH